MHTVARSELSAQPAVPRCLLPVLQAPLTPVCSTPRGALAVLAAPLLLLPPPSLSLAVLPPTVSFSRLLDLQ